MSLILLSCQEKIHNIQKLETFPPVFPDYNGVTIPVNIAPMNFGLEEQYEIIVTKIYGRGDDTVKVSSRDNNISIPREDWKELLWQNKGDSIWIAVSVKSDDSWYSYKHFPIVVRPDSIDYGIVFRLIAPGYESHSKMGIYERELSTFERRSLIENTQITNSCMNCHTFNKGNPYEQSIHIRGKYGATIVRRGEEEKILKSTNDSILASCMYPYWHPGGRFIAYSTNVVRQVFYTTPENLMESYDEVSDVLVYDIDRNVLKTNDLLAGESFESFPSFSADGKYLYFCTAKPQDVPREVKKIHYDICRIAFDSETGELGTKVDTVVNASSFGKSASLPRESYNGKFLVYTISDFGSFSLYHKESDLWLMDLETGEQRPLTKLNSKFADSYHNWSTNSSWLIFGSRRNTGRFTRAYIAYIDENGKEGKPFLLPQEKPIEYYQGLFLSYNTMEFVTGTVPFNARRIGRRLLSPEREKMNFNRQK